MQIILEFEEKYEQFAKLSEISAKNVEKIGILDEKFHFSFHYFIRVLGLYDALRAKEGRKPAPGGTEA